jgi:hypothetical protein
MSKESRLDYLGVANGIGPELTEALNNKLKEVQSDPSMGSVEKTMRCAAIRLELQREESRAGAMSPKPND